MQVETVDDGHLEPVAHRETRLDVFEGGTRVSRVTKVYWDLQRVFPCINGRRVQSGWREENNASGRIGLADVANDGDEVGLVGIHFHLSSVCVYSMAYPLEPALCAIIRPNMHQKQHHVVLDPGRYEIRAEF